MPTIHVQLFAGRTIPQKRALAQALTQATVQTLGGSAEAIDVIFTDIHRHDWATAGRLWSDAAAAAAPALKPRASKPNPLPSKSKAHPSKPRPQPSKPVKA